MIPRLHADVRPARIQIADAQYQDGYISLAYAFRYEITGEDVEGYDYIEETHFTKVPSAKVDIPTVRDAILKQYGELVTKWETERARREAVEAYTGFVVLP